MAGHRSGDVLSSLPAVLRARGISWNELARRTMLPTDLVARLRTPGTNPPLAVAERVATALDLPVEELWKLP